MNQYARPRPTWMKVQLYGPDAKCSAWHAAARREGHHLLETEDEEGALVTVVIITDPAQVGELCSLMEAVGVHGSLSPLL